MLKEVMANALLAAAALSGSVVHAENEQIIAQGKAPDSVSRTVSYADLDLNDDSGVSMLKIRVRKASKQVCSEVYQGQPINELWAEYRCRKNAYRGAKPQIVDAVKLSRSGGLAAHAFKLKVSVATR